MQALSSFGRTGCNLFLSTLLSAIVFPVFAARPANDDFADRMHLSISNARVTGRTLDASIESEEPNPASKSLWYTWTAAPEQPFAVVIEESSFAVDLRLFTGDILTNLTPVPQQLTFPGGHTYQIRVCGRFGSVGDFTFSIRTTTTAGGPIITSEASPQTDEM
jgi:hypothetical protein